MWYQNLALYNNNNMMPASEIKEKSLKLINRCDFDLINDLLDHTTECMIQPEHLSERSYVLGFHRYGSARNLISITKKIKFFGSYVKDITLTDLELHEYTLFLETLGYKVDVDTLHNGRYVKVCISW